MMRTVVAAGAGLIALGLLTGCGRSTDGTVAMTTEPGPPLSSEPATTGRGTPGLPQIPGLPEITAACR